jgi:hypothetical protein
MDLKFCIEKLSNPSVKSAESINEADLRVIDEPKQELAYDWMHSIKMFLENQSPSHDNVKIECIAHQAKQYHLVDGILFR